MSSSTDADAHAHRRLPVSPSVDKHQHHHHLHHPHPHHLHEPDQGDHSSSSSSSSSSNEKSAAAKQAQPSPTQQQQQQQQPAGFLDYVVLGRPKFLLYSLACHAVGVLVAQQKGCEIDWLSAALLQLTIWSTHLMTHYINEYGDYDADRLNTNAGSWTGGSKVLHKKGVSRTVPLVIGIVLQVVAFCCGAASVLRFVHVRHGVPVLPPQSMDDVQALVVQTFAHLPLAFVLFGLSVFFVAFAYSVPPLRLSAVGLGELCVSYVLTFTVPVVGCLLQGGALTYDFFLLLTPIFLMNLNRMIIMNIPDRAGDRAAGKVTSVVMVGEERAVAINNAVYLATYLVILPQLNLGPVLTVAYLLPLPLRWWQSLRINTPVWWSDRHLVDSIPFVESMFILVTVTSLALGLFCQGHEECSAFFDQH